MTRTCQWTMKRVGVGEELSTEVFRMGMIEMGQVWQRRVMDQDIFCSTKGSVVGAVMTVLLLQVGLIAGFWFFYRARQRLWDKANGVGDSQFPSHTLHHHQSPPSTGFSTSPEVIFRNVYDRLSAGGRRPFLIPFPNSASRSHHRETED